MDAAVRRHNPHVVVGYSWGGATAVFARGRNVWQGPTVLLAPAAHMLAAAAGLPPPVLAQGTAARSPAAVVLVHGRHDSVVPFEHSKALAGHSAAPHSAGPGAGGHARTRFVPGDDDHFLHRTCTKAALAGFVLEALERHSKAAMGTAGGTTAAAEVA